MSSHGIGPRRPRVETECTLGGAVVLVALLAGCSARDPAAQLPEARASARASTAVAPETQPDDPRIVQSEPLPWIVYFSPDSADLSSDAMDNLRLVAHEVVAMQHRIKRLELVGAADSLEGNAVALATARASAVKGALVAEGVPSELLHIAGNAPGGASGGEARSVQVLISWRSCVVEKGQLVCE